jgi:hypothetical protein
MYMYLWKSEHTCIARLLLLTQPGDCSLVEWLSNPNESHRRCASTINALLERLKRTRGWVDPNGAYALSTHVVLRHESAEEHSSRQQYRDETPLILTRCFQLTSVHPKTMQNCLDHQPQADWVQIVSYRIVS